ncbi:MAG: ATP-dependent helicase HrpB [Bacteroidales bacterium]|nr:ATP-dependent helicase HrpB [Bacteroidales bacterium]
MIDNFEAKRLPAYSIADEVNRKLAKYNRLVITAPPGAGKSTLLPLTILEGMKGGGKVVMLEPRRIAARQVADRMATLLNERVGETVGYRIRFEKNVSSKTRIEVVTEGILTRMLIADPTLEGISVVIFDEFHERSLNSDVALALTRESQNIVRPDLKIVIMSATIDATEICSALNAPFINSEGKMFDVEVINSEKDVDTRNMPEEMARAICRAHREHDGDILAFLPGQAEILKCSDLLGNELSGTKIMPLYGNLSLKEQRAVISPSAKGERKVVLATPIAETSLTINGVKIVVDSGFCKTMVFDPRNGLSHLETVRISMDMANQRKGRAGRVSEGVCYRLWTKATEHKMAESRKPEIVEADLSPVMLDVAAWGENEVMRLPWLTPPPQGNVSQASRLLRVLDAIDENGNITETGRKMSKMPSHPRISKMLISAENDRKNALAADIAAVLEEKDQLSSSEDSDINTRIGLLRKARRSNSDGRWNRIILVADEYLRLVHAVASNEIPDVFETGGLLASAYPERIAKSLDNNGRYKLASGGNVIVNAKDDLASHEWLAVAALNAASGNVFLASPLKEESLPAFAKMRDNIYWDSKKGQIVARKELCIGTLVVESRQIQCDCNKQIVKVLCDACAKDGLNILDFSEDVERLQRRISAVSSWHPELELPDLSTSAILKKTSEWLPFYIENGGRLKTDIEELKKIDLCAAIWAMLRYEQQQIIDRLAPSHIVVPTGSRIRVDYRQGADNPIVSVRLQECFGLIDTPRVDDGKRPVLMELLSPGFKPVQLTQDLRSFWQGTYFEVKKELKRRYPKHYWPDNPLEAEAVRGVKRVKS